MGTVVTVMNMKGGVGKTTVTMHLAGMITRMQQTSGKPVKVLAIDYDPQFNLSQAFLPAKTYFELEKLRKTSIAVLLEDDSDLNPYQLQVSGNLIPPAVSDIASRVLSMPNGSLLDLVPSTLDLMYVALGQANANTKPIEERFEKFMDECRENYDLVFIDCHPAGSLFTKTALKNSQHVLIPVSPQKFSARGIGLMMEFIKKKGNGDPAVTPHILFNLAPRTGISKQETEIRANPRFAKYCLDKNLKRYKAFADPEGGKGFVWSSGKAYSSEAFFNLRAVAAEFVDRLGQTK
ncbi:ParA family protein [Paraburkholderia terricola]|uniref:ParA family protein n=1 Tax=Paraburkholderia terricola TaxID=169427 RepID=UPI00286B31C9|nr:ParA family protein [Paraburkholderia terricola]